MNKKILKKQISKKQIDFFRKNFDFFSSKISIFPKNFDFSQKFRFFPKISVIPKNVDCFPKIFDFWRKYRFLNNISIFDNIFEKKSCEIYLTWLRLFLQLSGVFGAVVNI